MSNARIDLQIDELVLHGADPGNGDRIAAAVQRELARLFGARGVPEALRVDPGRAQVDAGAATPPTDASPETLGVHAAQGVYWGLSR
jgi:hypothetical protein